MNESTPLLGQVTGHVPPTEPDLFLQVVESPWPSITAPSLFFIRALLAATTTSLLALSLTLAILTNSGPLFAFRLTPLASGVQCIYLWLTCYWTRLTASSSFCRHPYALRCHRHYHHHQQQQHSLSLSSAQTCLLACLHRFPSEHSTRVFTAFRALYSAAMILPVASALCYFTTTTAAETTGDAVDAALCTLGAAVVLAELLLLNSVVVVAARCVLVQMLQLAVLAAGYASVWVWVGSAVVNGRGRPLDGRLYGGGGWRAADVVVGLCVGWWGLERAKGRVLEWGRRRAAGGGA